MCTSLERARADGARFACVAGWLVMILGTARIAAAPCSVQPNAPDRTAWSCAQELGERGDFAAALALIGPRLGRLDHQAPSMDLASALRLRGWIRAQQADFAGAALDLERALQLFGRLAPTDLGAIRARGDLGVVYRETERYAEARVVLDQARRAAAARRDRRGLELLGRVHNDLGGLAYYQSDLRTAVREFEHARRIMEPLWPQGSNDLTKVYNNLGLMYFELGDHEQARPLLERSVDMKVRQLGPSHPGIAGPLTNLGIIAEKRGELAVARAHLNRAIAVTRAAFGNDHPGVVIAENTLGWVEHLSGNASLALSLLQHALAVRESVYGRDSLWVADTLNYLSLVQSSGGQRTAGRETAWRSLANSAGSKEPEVLWKAYASAARVMAFNGDVACAIFFGKHAVNVIQSMRVDIATLQAPVQRSFLEQRQTIYRDTADWLLEVGRLAEAEQVNDMLKEEEYFDFVRGQVSPEDAGTIRAEYAGAERNWYSQLDAAARALGDAKDGSASQVAARAVFGQVLRDAYDALRVGTVTGVSTNVSVAAMTELPPGSAVLRYLVLPQRVDALLTADGRTSRQRLSIDPRDLGRQVARLRDEIRAHAAPMPAARALHESLIAPVLPSLRAAGVRRLALVLDGVLRYVPFAALTDGDRFLVEEFELRETLPAGRTATNASVLPRGARIAAFGVSGGALGLAPLVNVPLELDLIVRSHPEDRAGVIAGDVALDGKFTSARLRAALQGGYPLVHLASHFVLRPGSLEQSYLLLGSGGQLSLAGLKAGTLSLENVSLLTLSACATALGASSGDGREIESFGALAQRRGAAAVLATLWRVEDLGTSAFMARFYRHYATGIEVAAALQAAQRETLARRDGQRLPSYWAPFVVLGR